MNVNELAARDGRAPALCVSEHSSECGRWRWHAQMVKMKAAAGVAGTTATSSKAAIDQLEVELADTQAAAAATEAQRQAATLELQEALQVRLPPTPGQTPACAPLARALFARANLSLVDARHRSSGAQNLMSR